VTSKECRFVVVRRGRVGWWTAAGDLDALQRFTDVE
jgi:hypothetical protein